MMGETTFTELEEVVYLRSQSSWVVLTSPLLLPWGLAMPTFSSQVRFFFFFSSSFYLTDSLKIAFCGVLAWNQVTNVSTYLLVDE